MSIDRFAGRKIVLVEPDWNYNINRKSWKKYMRRMYAPVGLLKIAAALRNINAVVELVRYGKLPTISPDFVFVTSLFTYWWRQVWSTVQTYKMLFPDAIIIVGGIYASIMPEHCKKSGCHEVFKGLMPEAEKVLPSYDLIPDYKYALIHASRGCIHRCAFCYAHKLEPDYVPKTSIKREIVKPYISFLDNNLLANPHIENILQELVDARVKQTLCLSGVEANLVTYNIARLMKKARFENVRIAFDRSDEEEPCKQALKNFAAVGFKPKDISVFTLYNFNDAYEECERRRLIIGKLGMRIIPQRYIPIPSLEDSYLHPKWTEDKCKTFARNCRIQSICIRYCSENPFTFFTKQAGAYS